MMQAAEEKSIPGFFNEAVYPTGKLRQLVCHGFPTCGSRPLVSDASGRWRLSLIRLVCTPSKLAAVLSPGTRALLPQVQAPTATLTRPLFVISVRFGNSN